MINLRLAALLPVVATLVLTSADLAAQNRVAVINVEKVFEEFKVRQEQERTLKVEIEKYNTELAELKVELEKLIERLKVVNPGSPERLQLEEQIYETRANIELFSRLKNIELEERMTDMTRGLYNSIVEAISNYAVQNGIGLVLKYEAGEIMAANPTDMKLEINARQVLYFGQSLDITNAIIGILNK